MSSAEWVGQCWEVEHCSLSVIGSLDHLHGGRLARCDWYASRVILILVFPLIPLGCVELVHFVPRAF